MLGQPIPEIRVKLYHATNSGKEFSTLISFLKYGARSDIAKGYGQGQGFYVWTTLKSALGHTTIQKAPPPNTSILLDRSGYPMILIFDEILNPNDWDLDYETNAGLVVAFLFGHWKLFQSIPDNVISIEGKYLLVSKCENNRLNPSYFWLGNISFKFSDGSSLNSIRPRDYVDDKEEGALLGKIFNYLQEHFPQDTEEFEKAIFKKMLKKRMGLKYVWNKPLKLANLMIEVDGKWLEGEEARSIARLNGVVF
jgi:hypothetical protein